MEDRLTAVDGELRSQGIMADGDEPVKESAVVVQALTPAMSGRPEGLHYICADSL
jgi:hypothetical protein